MYFNAVRFYIIQNITEYCTHLLRVSTALVAFFKRLVWTCVSIEVDQLNIILNDIAKTQN